MRALPRAHGRRQVLPEDQGGLLDRRGQLVHQIRRHRPDDGPGAGVHEAETPDDLGTPARPGRIRHESRAGRNPLNPDPFEGIPRFIKQERLTEEI